MSICRPPAAVLLMVIAQGCIAGVLPPSRTELGSQVIAADGGPRSGMRLATGAHLASGQVRPDVGLDVGAGYVYERQSEEGAVALGGGGKPSGPRRLDGHGMYLEVSHVLQGSGAARSWLGARGELMRMRRSEGSRGALGLYARAAWEVFKAGKAEGSGPTRCGFGAGFAHGAVALGLFVESGVRWVEAEEPAFVAVGGLTVRMPWMGGVAVDLCSWC
jgi:hypothetical protein